MSGRSCVLTALVLGTLLTWAAATRAATVTLDGRTFTLPDGFTIERAGGPPLVDRPITADFDQRGRLYVADSSGSNDPVEKQLAEKPHRVLRLEDSDGDGVFDKRTVFVDRVMFPEGTMWHAGSLYVAAPPSIWKFTDTNDDGVADEQVEWFQGKTLTHCANDLHGPYLGPDGWIYWCKGAFAKQTHVLDNGRKPLTTRASHIFRARPDGSGVEPVMTGGMDNPVDVVFTPGGERIMSATFLQYPAGGKRDGLIHAVYGGVYGKVHDVLDGHVRTSPDVMPILSHIGPAAACGLARYESTLFGAGYRDNLFTCAFNMHKVTRHVPEFDGSTFKSRDSDFLVCDSLDFHPTDVLADADGSLLVIDTGGWYKLCCPTSQLHKPDVLGAIYRVRRDGAERVDDPRGLNLNWDELENARLVELLDDERPAVRDRAVRTLAGYGNRAVAEIEHALGTASSARVRVGLVWAATRIDHPAARAVVRKSLGDPDTDVRGAAAHSVSVWRDREATEDLFQLLRRPAQQSRRAAAEALGRVGDASAIPHLFAALTAEPDRVLEHSLTYALIEIRDAKATAAGLSHAHPAVRRAAMIALDQMENGGLGPQPVAAALGAPEPALRETAAWVAGRHPEWGEALAGALGERVRASDSLAEGDRAALQRQLARLARSPAIQKLIESRLHDPATSAAQRRLLISAMSGSGLGEKEIPDDWIKALTESLTSADASNVAAAVNALRRLPLTAERKAALAAPLLAVARREDLPANTRLAAAASLPGGATELDAALYTFLVARLDGKEPAGERVLAADVLAGSKLNAQQLSDLTAAIKTAGPLEISRLLAPFAKASNDDELGVKLVAALSESKAARSLRHDVVKAHLANFGPRVHKQAEALLAKLNPDADAQRTRLEQVLTSLPPGDVRRGQTLFNAPTTACASCHAIGYLGGKLGPDLTRIGAVRAERDLLESILFPSTSFVQSFEPVMVRTKRNEIHSGIMKKNDDAEVVLATGPEQEVRIPRADVKEMRPGNVSVMPAGLEEQLKPQELADLVAFLKACK